MSDDLALAFVTSPQSWFRRWTRHIADHGPGQVVDVVAEQRSAFDASWRLLVADSTSWAVTPAAVALIRGKEEVVRSTGAPAVAISPTTTTTRPAGVR